MIGIPVIHLSIGAVVILLAIPLILGKVPMNAAYGVRTRKAFTSKENWYAINAYGGKWLLAFGIVLVAVGLAGTTLAPSPRSAWAPVFLVAPLLLLVPVLVAIHSFERRLPDR